MDPRPDFGTRLEQKTISDVTDSGPIFSRRRTDGSAPLVLVPKPRGCLSCFLRIPSDAHVVFQKWGKDLTPPFPGRRCLCSMNRIAFLVTRQTCTYRAPVRNVPTKDNVKVKVNLTLVFSVVDPRLFVYNLGAQRFDELLHAAAEEAIRSLVRTTTIGEVYELRGQAADEMLDLLNGKFKQFGVRFSTCTVTQVEMPTAIAQSLEAATTFESRIAEQLKRHEFEMARLQHDCDKSLREAAIVNEKAMKELDAAQRREEIATQKAEIEAQRRREVSIIRAEESAGVRKISAESDLRNSKTMVERETLTQTQKAQSGLDSEVVRVNQEVRSMVVRSKAAHDKAKNTSLGKAAEADAESAAGEMLQAKREHELSSLRLDIVHSLARKGRMMITGDAGEKMLGELFDVAGELD
eukprot:TRINITY_DN691_c0_g1_i1.p1 TRINITY_DN691_c0_g1~~TRINITY_DN691_c0_g1_i1.p1  ORF type:complete len:409 (+),score=117.20 TRINITY_DN691_c0_g1_i1:348-1574(+)